ncbi:MAG: MFS transporter, partial [Boseongicola sp.]|nr:MFS transporter [Boseongicola sp.]
RVLLLIQLGTLISWGVFLIAFTLPATSILQVESRWLGDFVLTLPLLVLFLARAADGITGGNVSVSNAYLADITPEEERSKNFGQMAVSSNLGFVLGPALAGLLGATVLGEIVPVFAAFAISAIALALIQFGLVDVSPKTISETLEEPSACELYGQEHKPAYELDCHRSDGLPAILKLPHLPALLSVNFLVMLGFSFFYVAFPVHAVEGLGWSVTEIGGYFAGLSLAMIVVQGPVLSRVSERYEDRSLMFVGGLVLSVGFALLYSGSTGLIYLSALLVAVGNGLMWPTFMSVLSAAAGTRLQGAVQGFAQSAGAVASIIGLVAGGVLFVTLGATLFPLAAIIIVISAFLASTFRQSEQHSVEPGA